MLPLQLVLNQAAWEEVVTVNVQDGKVIRNLLTAGDNVRYDVGRRVLMFGTEKVG